MDGILQTASWGEAWKNEAFRIILILTFVELVGMALVFPTFFDFIEARNGPQLSDIILDILPAADVSWVVFFFLYAGIAIGLFSLYQKPQLLILAIQTYILGVLFRMLTITLFPLVPPDGYIPLKEPVVQLFTNNSRIISHDLFFSGHVSTICSVLFAVRGRVYKTILLVCTIAISVLVLVQRVHYTIDVLAAPVATYGCYLLAKRLLSRF